MILRLTRHVMLDRVTWNAMPDDEKWAAYVSLRADREELLSDFRELSRLYDTDKIASPTARQIERIFDRWVNGQWAPLKCDGRATADHQHQWRKALEFEWCACGAKLTDGWLVTFPDWER